VGSGGWTGHNAELASNRKQSGDFEARVRERTAQLEDERAALEAIVEKMPAGLVIVDRERNVVVANDRAREILGEAQPISSVGWPGYAMDGRPYQPDEFPLERTLRSGEVVNNERIELVPPEGPHVILEVSTAPVRDSAGAMIGGLSLFQDVTDQQRRERAERDFVTNAAHELQSPLAGIISAVEVLQAGAKEGPERDIFIGHIERESHRLARLARALLILARAQTGYEAPKEEVVALEPLLADIARSLTPAKGVEVHVACPPALAVVTNRELVEQAFENVVQNAAKVTMAGRIELEASSVDDGAVVVIRDTGPGIDAAEQPLVVERFYRGMSSSADGFGLGLAIVRSAVEALDGRLEFESDVGAGTTVRIHLPRAASLVEP
jgi:PAS domain S-box-containing protein